MASLAGMLIRLAVALLPTTEQARYLDEWRGEVASVRDQSGHLAAVRFAIRLVLAAPRMTMSIRSDSESGYAELSIGLSFSIFPSLVLVVLALYTRVWIMVIGELAIIVGIVLMASGFWSVEGRLLDSTRSRVGVALALVGSVIEVAVRRLTGFGPPIDEVVSATIPHTLGLLGLILMVSSSYAGRFRRRVQLAAIASLAPGAVLNMVVTVINGFALSGFDRFGVLMYVIPSAALAWASYAVLMRPKVFENSVAIDV